MLLGVNGVERVEGLGVDGMAGDVLAPVVEGDAPRVGAVIGAEAGELVAARLEALFDGDWDEFCAELGLDEAE